MGSEPIRALRALLTAYFQRVAQDFEPFERRSGSLRLAPGLRGREGMDREGLGGVQGLQQQLDTLAEWPGR